MIRQRLEVMFNMESIKTFVEKRKRLMIICLFEQYAEHEAETPIERYKRLMAELQELEEEFNQVTTNNSIG